MISLDQFLTDNAALSPARTWATQADTQMTLLETATSAPAATTAQNALDVARGNLLGALLGVAQRAGWTTSGFGLLSGATALQERDPSLFGLYNAVLSEFQEAPGAAAFFACCVEVYLYVYPERAPLDALVQSCARLVAYMNLASDVSASFFKLLNDSLRAGSFWVPQGASSLDKFATQVQASLLDTGAAAGAAPTVADEEVVRQALQQHVWSWAALRDDEEFPDDQFQEILAFRKQLTDTLMRAAIAATATPQAVQQYGNRYRWVTYSAPGSTRRTSDIDVNMRGSLTESVVAAFNTSFRAWSIRTTADNGDFLTPAPGELESGFMFDVNVYANDYLQNSRRRFIAAVPPEENLWPTDAGQRLAAEGNQALYALLKMRRYMSAPQWTAFGTQLQQALGGPANAGDAMTRLTAVDALWTQMQGQIAGQLANLPAPLAATPIENRQTRAENELYQAQLNTLQTQRWNAGALLNDAQKVTLAASLGQASALAQEAYHTSGAVLDIVANTQMRSGTTLTDSELLCSFNEQVGDIFKEIDHSPAAAAPGATLQQQLDLAIEASKYMVRLGNAALNLNYRVVVNLLQRQLGTSNAAASVVNPAAPADVVAGSQAAIQNQPAPAAGDASQLLNALQQPLSPDDANDLLNHLLNLQELCNAWRTGVLGLLEIKDNPSAFQTGKAWNPAAQGRLAGVPSQGSVTALASFLIALAALGNAQFRGILRQNALPKFLRECFVTALQAARSVAPAAAAPH